MKRLIIALLSLSCAILIIGCSDDSPLAPEGKDETGQPAAKLTISDQAAGGREFGKMPGTNDTGVPIPPNMSLPDMVVNLTKIEGNWIHYKVMNIGNAPVLLPRQVLLRYHASLNGKPMNIDNNSILLIEGPFPPGSLKQSRFAVGYGSYWQAGDWEVRLEVDQRDLITESDENNNLSGTIRFRVSTADEMPPADVVQQPVGYSVSGVVSSSTIPLAGVEVQLLKGDNVTQTVILTTVSGANGSYEFKDMEHGEYWVSARGLSDQYAYVVGSRTFRITEQNPVIAVDIDMPKAIIPLSPASNDTISTLRPMLKWEPVPEAKHYKIQLNIREGWVLVLHEYYVEETSYPITFDLLPNTLYIWNVDGYDSEGRWVGTSRGGNWFYTQ